MRILLLPADCPLKQGVEEEAEVNFNMIHLSNLPSPTSQPPPASVVQKIKLYEGYS